MPFEFGDYQLRTFVDKTGEPWFCLKDTCEILNVGNPSDVVKRLQKSRVVSIEVAFKRVKYLSLRMSATEGHNLI
jgi:prophage antirepressor-like protein